MGAFDRQCHILLHATVLNGARMNDNMMVLNITFISLKLEVGIARFYADPYFERWTCQELVASIKCLFETPTVGGIQTS